MKLKILKVHNHGDHQNEYVFLEVLEDCDIGEHILADSTYTSDGNLSNKVRHTFWFPDRAVKKGDRVSVRTKSGPNGISYESAKDSHGNPLHRFYWGLEEAIWNDEGDAAILFHIDEWRHFKVVG